MKKFVACLWSLVFLATSVAKADWIELGDAGQTLASAQVITNFSGPTRIRGAIAVNNDVDLYQFYISSPSAFIATTVGQPGTLSDTQLFLFRANGTGVAANDDFSGLRSTINNSTGLLTTLTAGLYYLAISSYDTEPFTVGGQYMFPLSSAGILAPTTAGANNPLVNWDSNFGFSSGTYEIQLSAVVAVPVPAGGFLAFLGFATVIGFSRYKQGQKQSMNAAS